MAQIGANGRSHKDPDPIITSEEMIKKLTNCWIYCKFPRHWKEVSGIVHTRAFIRESTFQIGRAIFGLDRKRLVAVIGTISGHWYT